jgi:hypothetical protein
LIAQVSVANVFAFQVGAGHIQEIRMALLGHALHRAASGERPGEGDGKEPTGHVKTSSFLRPWFFV